MDLRIDKRIIPHVEEKQMNLQDLSSKLLNPMHVLEISRNYRPLLLEIFSIALENAGETDIEILLSSFSLLLPVAPNLVPGCSVFLSSELSAANFPDAKESWAIVDAFIFNS